MKVKDLPPGRLHAITPATTLAAAARQMRVEDVDSVAVLDDGRLVGIITERDLVGAIADGLNPTDATAQVVMSANPATVEEEEEISVVAMKMIQLGVRHMPVVNEAGVPVGLLSAREMVAVLDRNR